MSKVTSAQLNPTAATDANGWLVRDMGTFKIATKVRTWTSGSLGNGAAGFASMSDSNSPVGYSSGFTVASIVVNAGGAAGGFEMNWETNALAPNSGFVIRNNSGGTASTSGTANFMVIF